MNRKPLILLLLIALSLALLCCAFVQHGKLAVLRNQLQQQQREQQVADTPRTLTSNAPSAVPADAPRPVSSELLKLRNEVSQLTRRRDELAAVGAENERLKAQLAGRATNGPASLVYIRKAEANFSGYDTPQHTLQTFLWAIRTKDYETWLNTLAPEFSEGIRKVEQGPGFSVDKIFEGADAIPGFAIVGTNAFRRPDGEAANAGAGEGEQLLSMQVQIAPDIPPEEMVFRLIGGQWKMAFPGIGH